MRNARIGAPIVIMVIGAILRWAVADAISGVDLAMIGLIMLVAGGVWLILELVLGRPRSRVTTERTDVQGGGTAGQHVEREIRRDDV